MLIYSKGYRILNVDSIIIAQSPKLSPHIENMSKNIAEALRIDASLVSVKATTTEKLGFAGRGEGIASEAVCIID